MRTTLTLEDDVAALIRERLERGDIRLKDLVNQALRLGLDRLDEPEEERPRYRLSPIRCGAPKVPLEDIAGALAAAEGDDWR